MVCAVCQLQVWQQFKFVKVWQQLFGNQTLQNLSENWEFGDRSVRFNIRRIEISFFQTWSYIGSFEDDWDRAN